MLRRALLPLALGLLLAAGGGWLSSAGGQDAAPAPAAPAKPAPVPATARTATIVLVRHAEKDPAGDARDPGLSAEGRARAQRLAQLFAKSGAVRLYASEYKRTRETLAPLSELLKIEVESVPAADAARLQGELDKLEDGAVAIVAGHSNTLPALARALGGELKGLVDSPQGKLIDERDNGRIFVLTRRVEPGAKTETRVLELRCPD